jgi:hypothetical protein
MWSQHDRPPSSIISTSTNLNHASNSSTVK